MLMVNYFHEAKSSAYIELLAWFERSKATGIKGSETGWEVHAGEAFCGGSGTGFARVESGEASGYGSGFCFFGYQSDFE